MITRNRIRTVLTLVAVSMALLGLSACQQVSVTPQSPSMEVISMDPASPAVLEPGQRLYVKFRYDSGGAKSIQTWVRSDGKSRGSKSHPCRFITDKKGVYEGWFFFEDNAAKVKSIKLRMRDTKDKHGYIFETSVPVDYKWKAPQSEGSRGYAAPGTSVKILSSDPVLPAVLKQGEEFKVKFQYEVGDANSITIQTWPKRKNRFFPVGYKRNFGNSKDDVGVYEYSMLYDKPESMKGVRFRMTDDDTSRVLVEYLFPVDVRWKSQETVKVQSCDVTTSGQTKLSQSDLIDAKVAKEHACKVKDDDLTISEGEGHGNKLEFRILPDAMISSRAPSPLRLENEMEYRKDLRENGPDAGQKRGDEYIWVEVEKNKAANFSLLVTEKTDETDYVLAANLKDKMMLSDGTWGLQKVYAAKDLMGRPAVKFECDIKGSELFYKLTSGNINTRLGMIVDGKIYAAPQINEAIRGQGIIAGRFSEAEVKDIVGMLSKGMPAVTPWAKGHQAGFGPTIEITINDNIAVGTDSNIDFDTGRLFSRPENWREMSADDGLRWIEKTGFDASGATRSTVRGLDCDGMIFIQRTNSRWDKPRVESLAKSHLWKIGKPGKPAYMTAQGQLPVTYEFKTREGGIGVLQITGFNDEPRGVNIQYKMIERYDVPVDGEGDGHKAEEKAIDRKDLP